MAVGKGVLVFALFVVTTAGLQFTSADESNEIDTESLFGFVTGTDVNDAGEKELEAETNAGLGKGAGSYSALQQSLSLEYTPFANFRTELSGTFARYSISGVPGLEDLNRGSPRSLSAEFRYRLLDREKSGLGLTFLAEPTWGFIDDVSGQPADQLSSEMGLLIDREVIPGTIAALNVLYEPQWTRLRGQGSWNSEAMFTFSTGVMTRIENDFFVGAELRYLRSYDTLGLSAFLGDALFLGPVVFYRPSENWRITAAWSTQIAGHIDGTPSALELRDFVKNQFKLRVGRSF